ncbi:hypothetical protein F5882DRAFT_377206 [Hyaloscypha sp. PMI_1271]|nr:hypothetical protein F5882DRAFT_377206 [Hyaloscypha sp. PMI_1271]
MEIKRYPDIGSEAAAAFRRCNITKGTTKQTHSRADATESSNETPGTFKHLKRKSVREMEAKASLSSRGEKRPCPAREQSIQEDIISPQSQFNRVVQRGVLDSISPYIGQCTAGNRNNPEATQAIDLISHLYSNKLTDDTLLTESTDSLDPTTPGSDNIDRTQPPQTDNTENPSQYRAESGWSEFNAYDPMLWGYFTMPN